MSGRVLEIKIDEDPEWIGALYRVVKILKITPSKEVRN